ncbi:hypothetical protein PAHAL_9G089200 [Panicum hallii]|uniref:SMP domain-containing protein n=1 Tax=Panicum hallii TaxID=206008 RepID=A0A2S3II86_9POAL|nr:late embryogenesis abundant protein 3-like [Panicum hallii]PAN45041.1 hypothetical protein PAHAL_9G089200 [Panicum hallii]
MEARPSRIECPEPSEQPEPTNPGRVFDTERVAPRDATESITEQLGRGGSRDDGAVDETYDTRVKIGEALEGSARAIGDKPVERSHAAAICAAEACAVGGGGAGRGAIPGGVAERARAAVAANARAARGEDKVTMADVLTWDSTTKLPTGKAVTSEVAAAAAEAEAANDPRGKTDPRGVSAALDMAAKHNSEHERAA